MDYSPVCCLPWPKIVPGLLSCLRPALTSACPWISLFSAACLDLCLFVYCPYCLLPVLILAFLTNYAYVCNCPYLCLFLEYAYCLPPVLTSVCPLFMLTVCSLPSACPPFMLLTTVSLELYLQLDLLLATHWLKHISPHLTFSGTTCTPLCSRELAIQLWTIYIL